MTVLVGYLVQHYKELASQQIYFFNFKNSLLCICSIIIKLRNEMTARVSQPTHENQTNKLQ